MKILKKILIIALAIFITLFIAGYIFVAGFAKNIITGQIENLLKVKAEVQSVSLGLPLNLNISGLAIGDLVKIEQIRAYPSLVGVFSGKIVLNSLVVSKPVINIERDSSGKFNLPELPQGGESPILIAGIFVNDGSLTFTDRKISAEGLSFLVKNINAKVYKAGLLPLPLTIKYDLNAVVPPRAGMKETVVNGAGWIDLTNKNMDGDLSISDIDIMYFRQYLANFMPLPEQANETPTANFSANLSAKNNDLLIKCRLTKNPAGETMFDFFINTKLDKPQFNMKTLQVSIFQNIIQQALENPEEFESSVKDIGKQFKEKGKELEKTFKEIFKNSEE